MSKTTAVDEAGWLHRLEVPAGMTVDRMKLPAGWRFATGPEIDAEDRLRERRLMHGTSAHWTREAVPVYALAATIGGRVPFELTRADLDELNASVVGQVLPQAKTGSILPISVAGREFGARGRVDVEDELGHMLAHAAARFAAGDALGAAAHLAWRLTWLHPFHEANGRTSRAAAYALLLAGDPQLRLAHAKRSGTIGCERLTVPERIERSRSEYIDAVNDAHDQASREGPGYRRTVDLARLERYLATLAADQLAERPSQEDRPCGCRALGPREST